MGVNFNSNPSCWPIRRYKVAVQFREKALMAYETMPSNQKNKVSRVIQQLEVNDSQHLNSHILKDQDLDTWVVRVDKSVRLLFTKTDLGFLVIDIIDRSKEDISDYAASL
jgi:mRNA-degrading endonuclease RelE of RelBE toxin-antitoxin system